MGNDDGRLGRVTKRCRRVFHRSSKLTPKFTFYGEIRNKKGKKEEQIFKQWLLRNRASVLPKAPVFTLRSFSAAPLSTF